MAREQTIYSELALGLGVLGFSAADVAELKKIENVEKSDVGVYESEHSKKAEAGEKMAIAGRGIRTFVMGSGTPTIELKWTGGEKIGSMENAAKDLEIKGFAPIRISVKESSNILINGSPVRVFELLPLGDFERGRGGDWYQYVAKAELDAYFQACGGKAFSGFDTVEEYYKNVKSAKRKPFSNHVSDLHKANDPYACAAYRKLCEAVSERSAEIFNRNMAATKANKNSAKRMELIFHHFFRINGVRYILAGTDGGEPFAVTLDDSRTWGSKYEFNDIVAFPKEAGQPEVVLKFFFKDKKTNKEFTLDLKAEVRWSHGKFRGNPESKLYKQWKFKEVPWAERIL